MWYKDGVFSSDFMLTAALCEPASGSISAYLDVGVVDLSQQDLLRLQAAELTQLFLQPRVLLVHVQPQAVTHRSGAVQFDHCKHNNTLHKHMLLFFFR